MRRCNNRRLVSRFVEYFLFTFCLFVIFIHSLPLTKNEQLSEFQIDDDEVDDDKDVDEETGRKFVRNNKVHHKESLGVQNCPVRPSLLVGGNKDDLVWTESADKLFDLLKPNVYNRHLAPGQLSGNVTTVNVAFYIESMSTFRAQSMDFELDMYLAMSWVDHRLKHNCGHPILITDVQISEQLWHPDLYFVNSKMGYIHQVTTPNFMVLVYSDGFVFKSMRVDVVLSCILRLEFFPMDQQECPVTIQSYAYVQNVVNLTWHVDEDKGYPISYNEKLEKGLSDMDLIDRKWIRCDFPYPMFRGSAVLVCISWCSFWLDVRASPARITLTITTLLTLTTMSNGSRQNLPQVSYMKSIDRWVGVCQAFVFSVLLEYTLVNFFLGQKTLGCKKHLMVQNESNKIGCSNSLPSPTVDHNSACGVCADQWELYAKRVDRVSRLVYPLAFVIFIIGYWFTYYDQLQMYDLF